MWRQFYDVCELGHVGREAARGRRGAVAGRETAERNREYGWAVALSWAVGRAWCAREAMVRRWSPWWAHRKHENDVNSIPTNTLFSRNVSRTSAIARRSQVDIRTRRALVHSTTLEVSTFKLAPPAPFPRRLVERYRCHATIARRTQPSPYRATHIFCAWQLPTAAMTSSRVELTAHAETYAY